MSQGSRYFGSGLWSEKISQKRNHGCGPIGEVRIFNMVIFLLKVRSDCLSNEKQVIKREKNYNTKQQEKSGYRCCYFDKNRQERYQQKRKYFNSKKRSRVVVLNSNACRNHRGCLFKVETQSVGSLVLRLWDSVLWVVFKRLPDRRSHGNLPLLTAVTLLVRWCGIWHVPWGSTLSLGIMGYTCALLFRLSENVSLPECCFLSTQVPSKTQVPTPLRLENAVAFPMVPA